MRTSKHVFLTVIYTVAVFDRNTDFIFPSAVIAVITEIALTISLHMKIKSRISQMSCMLSAFGCHGVCRSLSFKSGGSSD